uniref:nicalin-1-like n=1 Tax=Styela clava TaxID=7725 RepID=UPI00193A657E|nr:nicalin-1-like [Styela clava]
MLEAASQALDALKNSFPFAFFAFVPLVFIVVSPSAVNAAHEFTVYRMQQYDLQSKSYGCRNSLVNMEARTLSSGNSLARKCVVVHARDMTYERYMEAVERAMGALLIVLPQNGTTEDMKHFMALEKELLEEQTNVPIYFAHEDENLDSLMYDVQKSTSDDAESALEALLNSATSVGYQLVTSGGQSKPQFDHSIVNIQGYLPGLGKEDQLPTIAIVAHYDSYGIAPYLSYGANSDASGVVAVIELSRILSKLYSNLRTHPKHNILFLLSGGGKFNYQGTKRWIEDALDNPTAGSETISNLLSNVNVVLCLDSLASKAGHLHMHVSKPPKDGSHTHDMYTQIEKASALEHATNTTLIHKKIRLSADTLAWEHERYSIRRLPAVTLSSLESFDETARFSVMDQRGTVNDDTLMQNIRIINEAVLRYIYNVPTDNEDRISHGDYEVHNEYVSTWLDYLASQPRPEQDMHEKHPVVTSLESVFQKHLKNVQKVSFKADKRDPEFVLYDGLQRQMSASMVRSAVFDLYLSVIIASYVTLVFFAISKFSVVRGMATKLSNFQKIKTS